MLFRSMQDETGYLTMSPDVASFKDGVLNITTDIRFPSTHKKEEIETALTEFGVAFTIDNYQAPLYNDPNGSFISTLMQVYNEATGGNEKPIAIGGGTYARALKCGCGFGPEMPGAEATIHQANEYITFDCIQFMSEIYYNAIKALCCEACEETEMPTATQCASCEESEEPAVEEPATEEVVCEETECKPTTYKIATITVRRVLK